MFPESKENISQKFEILNNFIALLKALPDVESTEDLLKILVMPNKDINMDDIGASEKLDDVKQRVLKRDMTAEPIIEKLRPCFAHMQGSWPEQDLYSSEYKLNQIVIRQMNMLINTTEEYLNYMQRHIKYQSRCSKYSSDINNLIRSEILAMSRVSTDTLTAIFSLIDDIIAHDKLITIDLVSIYKKVQNKDEPLTTEIISDLTNYIQSKNDYYMTQRFSLFDLEKRNIVRNFSFDQQSKFFEM